MITSIENLKSAIQRLSLLKDPSVYFYNNGNTIRYLLCVEDEDDDNTSDTFTLGLYYDLGDPLIRSILKHSSSYVEDEDDEDEEPLLIEDFLIFRDQDNENNRRVFENLMDYINTYRGFKPCFCKQQFIEDGKEVCIACEMFASPQGLELTECLLCSHTSCNISMMTTPCCNTHAIHKECWEKCKRCPYCRAEENVVV